MTLILIPRTDTISAKLVAATDWEKYFNSIIAQYIVTGLTVSASTGLSVDITAGKARVLGLYLENTATANKGSLTASTTNYLYMKVTRAGSNEPESWDWFVNTIGGSVTDAFLIAKITTSASSVTDVVNRGIYATTTIEKGVVFPNFYETDRVFWRTDQNKLYKNTGTEGTPVWTELIPTPTFSRGTSFPTTIITKASTIFLLRTDTHTAYHLDNVQVPSGNTTYSYIDYLAENPYTQGTVHFIRNETNPIFSDNFSLYSTQAIADLWWALSGTEVAVNITNDNINIGMPATGSMSRYTAFTLDTLNDTAWVMRCKVVVSAFASLTTDANVTGIYIGMSSSSVGWPASQDYLGVMIEQLGTGDTTLWKALYADDVVVYNSATKSASIRTVTTETLWIELSRLSATSFKVELFSDAFSTSLGSATMTPPATIINLKVIKIGFHHAVAAEGTAIVTVDDIEIKDGVTTW